MFGKKREQTENQQLKPIVLSDSSILKYYRPKILLIDLKDVTEGVLKTEGYNVTAGSFGMPCKVPRDDNLCPVIVNGSLPPNFAEREIIVIDLVPADILNQPVGEKQTSPGKSDWWASCSEGTIDSRPRLMMSVKKDFDRILQHGGIFIIFATSRNRPCVIRGYQSYSEIKKEEDICCHNWGFLSILDDLDVRDDRGEEISVSEEGLLLGQVLAQHANGGHFLCTLRPSE